MRVNTRDLLVTVNTASCMVSVRVNTRDLLVTVAVFLFFKRSTAWIILLNFCIIPVIQRSVSLPNVDINGNTLGLDYCTL